MLLLSIKKIRERENEMLIQARNSVLSKRVAASENELDAMLRSIEKQVSFALSPLKTVYKVGMERLSEWEIDADEDYLNFSFRRDPERKLNCRWLRSR
jgi:hypothetical protein